MLSLRSVRPHPQVVVCSRHDDTNDDTAAHDLSAEAERILDEVMVMLTRQGGAQKRCVMLVVGGAILQVCMCERHQRVAVTRQSLPRSRSLNHHG